MFPCTPTPGLRSTVEDRWREASKATDGGDVEAMRRVDPDLVEKESQLLGSALRGVVEQPADGERALVVGHSPTTEAAVLGLTGTEVARSARARGSSSSRTTGSTPSSRCPDAYGSRWRTKGRS